MVAQHRVRELERVPGTLDSDGLEHKGDTKPAADSGGAGLGPEQLDQLGQAGLYRSLLASTLDPLVVIDAYGTIVLTSDSVERVFGYAADELTGQNVKILMPEPHRSAHDDYLENYRRTGETGILGRTRAFVVVKKDGSTIDCELSVSRVEPGEGRGPLFIGSFRDVSDRVAAERTARDSERRLQTIFERSFEFTGLLTPEGIVLEANPAALEATGIERDDAVGKPFWETRWWAVSAEERDRLRNGIQRAAKGEFVRFETRHLGRDGEVLFVDFSITPVTDDDGRVVMLVPEGRDITGLKRAQAAETSMLRSLATIGESASILAHEIKNPITSVNLALRAVADKLGEDQQAVLEDLVARMQRLERIMRRTLSFSRPLKLKLRTCDAGELLEGAIHDLQPALTEHGVRLDVDAGAGPLELHADGQLVGEVLTNLINNALEAIRDRTGTRIAVAVDRGEERVRFTVEDDGPGVPEGERELVFKPFHTTKSSGTGVGLAFSRKVAEAHGGTLTVDRSPLGGARFRLELPRTTTSSSPVEEA